MADDFSGVSISFDKATYNQGDPMTMTISGQATSSAGSTVQDSPVVTAKASDGASAVIPAGPVAITVTQQVSLATLIDSITDGARQWIIAGDGLSATATA